MEKSAELTLGQVTTEAAKHGDQGVFYISPRLVPPKISPCFPPASFFALSLCVLLMIFGVHQPCASAQENRGYKPKVRAKVKLSLGYDDNVSERREDRIKSRFLQFYLNSDMYMIPAKRTLLSLKLQDGLKYLDSPALSGESVLISGLNLNLSHRLSQRLTPELLCEVRGRTSIHNRSGVSPSEEAYLRGHIGAVLKVMLLADVVWRISYRYRFVNFEHFDPFDRRGQRADLRADVRLLPGSTLSLQYSREKTRFDKWELVSDGGEPSRTDTLDDMSLCLQLYRYLLLDITYSHQKNRSDVDGYSYRADKLVLLMARNLSRGIVFQLYALIRSKRYCQTPDENAVAQADLEDDERAVLTVKLSRDINESCTLEAQYDFRRSSPYKSKGPYNKGVLSLSVSLHF